MCGRFSFSPLAKIIEDRFDVKVDSNYKPRYNSAPSQNLAVITNLHPDRISFFKWGLVPFWAKDPKIGNKMINSKSETISEKPAFKNAFKRKRCLVPADSFYEWKKISSSDKIPYRILMKDQTLFAMAGIWETWKNLEGDDLHSFSILTTSANKLMENIHHRMPVILHREDEKKWIGETDLPELESLLTPFDENLMTAYPISKLVNSPANDVEKIHDQVDYS